ncbi:HdeD family acid-resistance protein [Aliiruegeria lutimaris]|uniref:Uncharacterized membrane protein HdeD, DUF308 family n=1 Tax=Aliiruegeria lutimaris TaxID=571298 RepID=A0A1G8Q837_9RHOB|nr:DUF308 domain-containing protein [Aliiruegeria lutimaris]SDJ00934.1 Uncharacterized membrane protein HdeD, DUF308 family [Aliiruegeria lutimaris]
MILIEANHMTNRILWFLMALIAIAGGVFALANPIAASVAATVIAGWMFLLIGIVQVVAGFRAEGTGAKIWNILLGLLAVVLGIMILGEPLKSMVALTTVVAAMFVATGISKIILSFSLQDRGFFWMVLISGIASLVLGLMIFANFPASAVSSLGILLGINLIFDGTSALAMAFTSDAKGAGEA